MKVTVQKVPFSTIWEKAFQHSTIYTKEDGFRILFPSDKVYKKHPHGNPYYNTELPF